MAWGRLDPIPLCCRGLHLFSDIYHTVKSDTALVEEAPQSKSPKPINGWRKERADFRRQERAREHLTSIAELSLCVPLSHWYFEGMHGTVTRAPHSNTHDVIEVLSLQAADDVVLGRVSSHACLCKYYFGSKTQRHFQLTLKLCKEVGEIQREKVNLKTKLPDSWFLKATD